jgi:protocatechuate 3,4-dioxygenase beta subunit
MARLALVWALFAVGPLLAQQAAPSPDDTVPLAIVRGRVVSSGDDPRPLPNARVVVAGSDGEPVFTTADGAFTARVPASFTLTIRKAGYAPAVVAGRSGTPDEMQITLVRGAALTGIVVDELGFPVPDARVRARWIGPGGPGLADVLAETDDAGEYRIGSLPAGRYALNTEPALPRPSDFAHGVSELDPRIQEMRRVAAAKPIVTSDLLTVDVRAGEETPVTLMHRRRAVTPPDAPIAGALGGVVLDEFGEPAEGVTVRLWRVRYAGDRRLAEPTGIQRRTDDRGQYRLFHVVPGKYLVAATDDDLSFAPVYYPGTTAVANASPIAVGRKEEIPGVTFVVGRTREARVSGVALDSRGGPLQGSVTLMASLRSGTTALAPRTTKTGDNGAFDFQNVAPGEYVLRATQPQDGGIRMQTLQEFGVQFVTVSGPDVPPLTIATSRAASIAGRVVLEGDGSGVAMSDFFISAAADPDTGPAGSWQYEGRVSQDGTFRIGGLAGAVRIFPMPAPGWWVKSIELGGIDAIDEPVRFAGPDDSRTDATVVMAPGAATLAGRVTDDAGRPVDDYRVVVFSTDRQRWFGRSPYVRITGGPEIDGGFTLRDLAPGDYWAVALDSVEGDMSAGEWQNPDFLASVMTDATRLTLGQGQRATTELRLARR